MILNVRKDWIAEIVVQVLWEALALSQTVTDDARRTSDRDGQKNPVNAIGMEESQTVY